MEMGRGAGHEMAWAKRANLLLRTREQLEVRYMETLLLQ